MEDEYLEIYGDMDDDQKSKCRLCGFEEKSKYLINIFGKTGRKYALDIKIRKCLPIVVREDDGMPKGVCMSCVNKLDVSSELVESSLRAHHAFLSVMTHDPSRADRLTVVPADEEEEETFDDESCNGEVDAEDKSCNGDDLSDSIATPQQLDDLPVVIKDEPMDMMDIDEHPDESSRDSGHWMNMKTSNKPDTEKPSNDNLSDIVVSNVNSISPKSLAASPSITVRSTESLMQPVAETASSDKQVTEQVAEQANNEPQHSSEAFNVDEPRGESTSEQNEVTIDEQASSYISTADSTNLLIKQELLESLPDPTQDPDIDMPASEVESTSEVQPEDLSIST